MPAENQSPTRPDAVELAAAMVGDRWTILILREAFFGVRRFGEIARNLGIARNVLTVRLKRLVADGLLERRRYRTDPDWYEYALTDAGRDLYGSILALLRWAEDHLATGGPELRLRHRRCGQVTQAKVVCAACGEELDPREVDAELID
ncbi:MAG: helix-turn-helix transcriptional regulator [Actinomycetota bacterium]|nr:helix-turn-helix transcriptional regulator [Actinomycetota bacterium]